MDSFLYVMGIFFVVFTVFILIGMHASRARLKRSERLMKDMMEEYENAHKQNPDDGFLRDNIIEFRTRRWEELSEKDKK
jgi:hypothetical protein